MTNKSQSKPQSAQSPKSMVPAMRPITLPYFAGIVDGEGFVGVERQTHGKRHSYSAVLSVKNTDFPLIHALKAYHPGYITMYEDKRANCKPTLTYRVRGNAVAPLLKKLLPHLRVKRLQAIILLNFLEMAEKQQREGGKYPPIVQQIRHRVYRLLQKLKER